MTYSIQINGGRERHSDEPGAAIDVAIQELQSDMGDGARLTLDGLAAPFGKDAAVRRLAKNGSIEIRVMNGDAITDRARVRAFDAEATIDG